MKVTDICLCLLVALLWGFNYLVIKTAVMAFGPMTAMTIRYILVTIVLFPFLLRLPRALYWPTFKVSVVLGFLYFAFFCWGTAHISASLAAVILQLQVPFGMIFSMMLLKEPPSRSGIVGTVFAFIGVFLAIGKIEWSATLLAVIFLLIASACWGYGSILIRHLKLNIHPLTLNAAIACFSLPFFIVSTLVMEPHASLRLVHVPVIAWAAMGYMVLIATIFCYGSWFKLIQRYSVAMVIPVMLLVPVFAILSGRIFLHEAISLKLILGTAITLGGIALVILPGSLAAIRRRQVARFQ